MKTTKDFLNESNYSDVIIDIMAFLVSAEEDNAMYGGIKASTSLIAFQNLLGYDDDVFEKLKDVFR